MKTISAVTSCLSDFDPDALRVDIAWQAISQSLQTITGHQQLALRSSLDRVLAEDVISTINVPAHDNAAMDGYALSGDSLQPDGDTQLRVIGTAFAGKAFEQAVSAGQAVRIMTGAVMPAGCDTVVIQENVRCEADQLTIPHGAVKAGDNRRLAGEDLAQGQVALPAGRIIKPADLGLLASLGVAEVKVKRKLRVAFFSTGDELRSIGQPLDEGCVYDSNRYTLFGALTRLRFVEIIDMGVVKDDPAALEQAMITAIDQADAIITSGGVSVGEADFTKDLMQKLGDVQFWKIAMRPGRPMAFGHVRHGDKSAALFGLPGNPVAVMVTFYAFAQRALTQLAGAAVKPIPMLKATLTHEVRKRPGRTEYQRTQLAYAPDGTLQASLTGAQGAGVLRSMAQADGLMVLSHEQGNLKAGDIVDVLSFHNLV